MASVADSINYMPSNLLVTISKMNSSGNALSVKTLDTVMLFKDDGMFANDENIVYTFIIIIFFNYWNYTHYFTNTRPMKPNKFTNTSFF